MLELVPGEGANTPPPPSSCFTINLWPKYFNIASILSNDYQNSKFERNLAGTQSREVSSSHMLQNWDLYRQRGRPFVGLVGQLHGPEPMRMGVNCVSLGSKRPSLHCLTPLVRGVQVTAVMKIPHNSLDQVWGRIVARVDLHWQKGFPAQSAGKTR